MVIYTDNRLVDLFYNIFVVSWLYHEQLFLSVYTELMDRPEFISVFQSGVADEDKAKFAHDRAKLLNEYHKVFGD